MNSDTAKRGRTDGSDWWLTIKRNRRIAMRFEKLAAHFLGMVSLAAILVWTL